MYLNGCSIHTFIAAFIEMLLVWTIHYLFRFHKDQNTVNFTADPFISITPVAMVTVKLCDQIKNPFTMIDGVYESDPGWYFLYFMENIQSHIPICLIGSDWRYWSVSHMEDHVCAIFRSHFLRFKLC